MKKTQFKGAALLLLTAMIWGSSFVAQSVGMDKIEAFTFNGIRTLMGAAFLLPVILIKDAAAMKKPGAPTKEQRKKENLTALRNGTFMGLALCAASNVQQFAFVYTAPGKIAFITAFYMFFVPIIGLLLHKKIPLITWLCVAAGCGGLYFLCIADAGFSGMNKGDILALICSVLFAVHIIVIEKCSPGTDPVKLSCVQFTVAGGISCLLMFIFESPSLPAINSCILPLLYSGIFSCGLAYTFQVIGQKYTESTVASLLMCMESVFGVIFSAIILKEKMTANEIIGCVIMFAAIIVSQFADRLADKFTKKSQ